MTVLPQRYKGESKREKVELMFDLIATRYDLLNRVLSGGIDKSWRKKAINQLLQIQPQSILDIATGTADLALEAVRLNPSKIIGVDISAGMLEIGKEKINAKNLSELIKLQQADSEKLPFEDNCFDAITVAFGVRNFEHLEIGLGEMLRVLKPQGMVVILEFSQPTKSPIKQGYNFYSKYILPGIGQLISKERSAYEYLPASVSAFPFGEKFTTILQNVGYSDTKCLPLTFGIASICTGRKK